MSSSTTTNGTATLQACRCHASATSATDLDLNPRLVRDCENCDSPTTRDALHHAEAHASMHGADATVHEPTCSCASSTDKTRCCCSAGACSSK